MKSLILKDFEVRGVLDGTVTQIARAIKPQPAPFGSNGGKLTGVVRSLRPNLGDLFDVQYHIDNPKAIRSPFGRLGGLLRGREAFVQGYPYDAATDRLMQWDAEGNELPKKTWYRADGADIGWADDDGWQAKTPWKSSVQMPRTASRITLKNAGVRVERVQECSVADAMKRIAVHSTMNDPRREFQWGFEENFPGAWGRNDWVFVLEIERVKSGD